MSQLECMRCGYPYCWYNKRIGYNVCPNCRCGWAPDGNGGWEIVEGKFQY